MKDGLGLESCDLVCQIGDLLNSSAEEPRHISCFARLLLSLNIPRGAT
jgi:hypothetical protein